MPTFGTDAEDTFLIIIATTGSIYLTQRNIAKISSAQKKEATAR
jgi:hypothetical protein